MSREVHQAATIVWTGTIARGSGEVSGASGNLGPLQVDLPNRLGQAHDKTTPEELLAAAHATCFRDGARIRSGRQACPARATGSDGDRDARPLRPAL